ncbi:MAG: thiamine-phosphate kinase [Methyloligellaceae bacterium]
MNERQSSGAAGASAEDEIIQRYFAPLTQGHPGALGLTDDAAVLTPGPKDELVLTADTIVAGVHFRDADSPRDAAHKALGVNVSDLVAKGAEPLVYLLSLALTGQEDDRWLAEFSDGLLAAQTAFGCQLLGGDTVKTPGPVTITITAIGRVTPGRMVRRSGATPGDLVFVSGTIGDAALGLRLLEGEMRTDALHLEPGDADHLRGRYLRPEPRVGLLTAVRDHASAAMDVSDGLAGDFRKLCAASGVGGAIHVADVPVSQAAGRALDADPAVIEALVTGGDDYEVLATVRADRAKAFEADAREAGVAVAHIGEILPDRGRIRFLGGDGKEMTFARESFGHF